MGGSERDAVVFLLPDVPAELRARAEQLATFLRLFDASIRDHRSPSARITSDRAVLEARRERSLRQQCALRDLLRAHLEVVTPADSFAWFGEMRRSTHEAWEELTELAQVDDRARVPAPGEAPLHVACRLVVLGERLGLGETELRLWRARIEWLAGEFDPAVTHLSELAGQASTVLSEAAGDDLAACQLDRGDVRGARQGLIATLAEARGGRAAWLLAVCEAVLDPNADRSHLSHARSSGPQPQCLVELRAELPDLAPLLNAPAREGERQQAAPLACDRRSCGAILLAGVVRHQARLDAREAYQDAQLEIRKLELAAGVRADVELNLEEWTRTRVQAFLDPGSPEHDLLRTADVVVRHRRGSQDLEGALCVKSRALVLAPVLDPRGEVRGWLHLEFDHHLVPGRRRLVRLARDWCVALGISPLIQTREAAFDLIHPSGAEPLAEVFRELAGELPLKLNRRRWFGFALDGPRPCLVAEGGQGLAWQGDPGGRGSALLRALASGGAVEWEEPDRQLSVHRDAASGCVLPVRDGKRVLALFVMESSRRRDLRGVDLARLASLLQQRQLCFLAAPFRAWHLDAYGSELFLPTREADFAAFVRRLTRAAHASSAVVLWGPAGCGKSVLARWMHFLCAGSATDLEPWERHRSIRPRTPPPETTAERRPNSILLEGLERLTPEAQAQLMEHLEAGDPRPRLIVTCVRGPREWVELLGLRDDLARALARLVLRVPPLCDRRAELPAWIRFLLARAARMEERPEPVLEDGDLALLWRQPWPGNLRTLEALLYNLVHEHELEGAAPSDLRSLLAQHQHTVLERLPSRDPRPLDVVAALWTTRTAGGRVNKTRAAAYLGWDPDTLAARMADLELDASQAPAPRPWTRGPSQSP